MNKKKVLRIWAILAGVLFLFPHYQTSGEGPKGGIAHWDAGWGTVLVKRPVAPNYVQSIDTALLALMQLVLAAIAIAALFMPEDAPSKKSPQPKPEEHPEQ